MSPKTLVSDSAFQDGTADKSGPTIKFILEERGLECKQYVVVQDEEREIRRVVQSWCDDGAVDLLITTGGTGFGIRDRTPEVWHQNALSCLMILIVVKAVSSLLEREASGLVYLILSSSLKRTPFAALSRPVAGTIKNTLVVTLPGSVKAVRENLGALLSDGVLAHAVDLIKGGSGKDLHAHLSTSPSSPSGSHHHHHRHHIHDGHAHSIPRQLTVSPMSSDPSSNGRSHGCHGTMKLNANSAVSARQRVSPYPLVSVKDALVVILQEVQTLQEKELPVSRHLYCDTTNA